MNGGSPLVRWWCSTKNYLIKSHNRANAPFTSRPLHVTWSSKCQKFPWNMFIVLVYAYMVWLAYCLISFQTPLYTWWMCCAQMCCRHLPMTWLVARPNNYCVQLSPRWNNWWVSMQMCSGTHLQRVDLITCVAWLSWWHLATMDGPLPSS